MAKPRWSDKRGALVSSQRKPNPKPTPQPDSAGTPRHAPTSITLLPGLTAAHTQVICTVESKTFHWNLYFKQSYFWEQTLLSEYLQPPFVLPGRKLQYSCFKPLQNPSTPQSAQGLSQRNSVTYHCSRSRWIKENGKHISLRNLSFCHFSRVSQSLWTALQNFSPQLQIKPLRLMLVMPMNTLQLQETGPRMSFRSY